MSRQSELAQLGRVFDTGPLSNRNLIINGAMEVAQRGTSFTNAPDSGYTLDRWKPQSGSGAQQANISQVTDAPTFFERSLELEVTTANASPSGADYYLLSYGGFEVQNISSLALGDAASKPITLSFWVKSSKTGTAYAEIQYSASIGTVENSIAYTVNSANTWEYKTLTFDAPTVFAPTTTTSNANGLALYFWLLAGSNYTGSPLADGWGNNTNRVTGIFNLFDAVGNTFNITGVQLEVGDTATPFEHRSYGDELARCERYYQLSGGVGRTNSTTGADIYCVFKTPMRATPSATINDGTSSFSQFGRAQVNINSISTTFMQTSYSVGCVIVTSDTGLTAGLVAATYGTAFAFDAEL